MTVAGRYDPEMGAGGAEGYGVGVHVGSDHVINWAATLPPRSVLWLELDFAKTIQHVDALLADPARGLLVGSAAIAYEQAEDEWTETEAAAVAEAARLRIGRSMLYTEAVLMTVPMLDPSMTYNVIAISSTVVAPVSYTHLTLPTKRIV